MANNNSTQKVSVMKKIFEDQTADGKNLQTAIQLCSKQDDLVLDGLLEGMCLMSILWLKIVNKFSKMLTNGC